MTRKLAFYALFLVTMTTIVAACRTTGSTPKVEPADTPTSQPTEVIEPTVAPTATEPPPTATELPPTETPLPPEPIVIHEDELAVDGCPVVSLNPESWGEIYAAYEGGEDPFFHLHSNEEDFHFNVELYTVWGASWTGQLGTFVPDCNGNGICIYLVPDNTNSYWATAGEVSIISLAQVDGVLSGPVEISMTDLTMEPVPGSGSQDCFHIDEVTLVVGEE